MARGSAFSVRYAIPIEFDCVQIVDHRSAQPCMSRGATFTVRGHGSVTRDSADVTFGAIIPAVRPFRESWIHALV